MRTLVICSLTFLVTAMMAMAAEPATPAVSLDFDAVHPPRVLVLNVQSATLDLDETDAISDSIQRLFAAHRVEAPEVLEARYKLIARDAWPYSPYYPRPLVASAMKVIGASYAVSGEAESRNGRIGIALALHKAGQPGTIREWEANGATLKEISGKLPGFVDQALAAIGQNEGRNVTGRAFETPVAKSVADKNPQNQHKRVLSSKEAITRPPQAVVKIKKNEPKPTPKPASEHTAPEHAASEHMVPEHAAPEHAAPEHAVPEHATPEHATPEHTAPEHATPEHATPEHAAPEHAAPEHAAPEHVLHEAETTVTPKPNTVDVSTLIDEAMALPVGSDERLKLIEQAAHAAPDFPDVQHKLAVEFYHQGNYAECAEACARSLEKKPDDSVVLTIQGSAYFEMRDYTKALAANEAALEADPDNHWARYNRALTLTEINDPQAADAWKEYIERAGKDPAQRSLVEDARIQLGELGGH